MTGINEIVEKAVEAGASDIHIVAGIPVRCRVNGQMRDLFTDVLSPEDCEALAEEITTKEQFEKLNAAGEIDFAGTFGENRRTRINLFRQQAKFSAAIRLFKTKIPKVSELNLPPVVETFSKYKNGLILVTGETGSGKSTTLAAAIDEINHSRNGHIITLEDPIEYVYIPDKCVVNQRNVGEDTKSYSTGLRAILREDPDIILVGEMNNTETTEAALTAAETGHLVFATLHTNSAADSIDRIVGIFPEEKQRQVRMQLSTTLRVVLSQQLIPDIHGKGRHAACEVMVVNPAIRNLIREGKTPQIDNYITTGVKEGSITMDNCIRKLLRENKISQEDAYIYARDKEGFSAKSF